MDIRLMNVGIVLVLVACCFNCGGRGNRRDSFDVYIPHWCIDIPENDQSFHSCSTATSKDRKTALEKAKAAARLDIARRLESIVAELLQQYREDTGHGEDEEFLSMSTTISKTVVYRILTGCKIRNHEVIEQESIFRAYVFMDVPRKPAIRAILDEMGHYKNIYEWLRTKDRHIDIDEAIERYEMIKENQ
jgi:hypothetical protein